ncbi:MAG: hypothetical protein RR091_09270 [Cloacibacillus sp.]
MSNKENVTATAEVSNESITAATEAKFNAMSFESLSDAEKSVVSEWYNESAMQLDRIAFINAKPYEDNENTLIPMTGMTIAVMLDEMHKNLTSLKSALNEELTVDRGVDYINTHLAGLKFLKLLVEHCNATYGQLPARAKTMRGIKFLDDFVKCINMEVAVSNRQICESFLKGTPSEYKDELHAINAYISGQNRNDVD